MRVESVEAPAAPIQRQYRQGDVLLIPTDAIPEKAKRVTRDAGRIVLAYGEVTGHAHAIASRGVVWPPRAARSHCSTFGRKPPAQAA